MTSNDPRAVVIRYVEAARDAMPAVIRDSFAEDATWEYPGDLHSRHEHVEHMPGREARPTDG
jgi:hypothetical protein